MCYFRKSLQADITIFYSSDITITCPTDPDISCDCTQVADANLLSKIKSLSTSAPVILVLLYNNLNNDVIAEISGDEIFYFSFIFVPQKSVIDNRLEMAVPPISYDIIYGIFSCI